MQHDLFGKEIEEIGLLEESTVELNAKKTGPNLFSLSDAFFSTDKKKIWKTYQMLLGQGVNAEELIPILWWAVKSTLLVAQGVHSEVKPFVAAKAKKILAKYSVETIKKLGDLYIQAVVNAREKGKLSVQIEQWILKLPFS